MLWKHNLRFKNRGRDVHRIITWRYTSENEGQERCVLVSQRKQICKLRGKIDTEIIFYHSIKQQSCNFYFILVHQLQQGIIYLIFLSCITVSDKACIFAYCHIGCNVQKVDIHGPHFPLIIFPLKEVKKGFANHLYFGKNIFNSTHYFKFMSESQSFVSPKKFVACILKRRYHVRINWRVLG